MSTRSCLPSQFSFLTQEQVDEFFRKYDRNGDGVITIDELTGIFPQLAGPSAQAKGSKPIPASKALPPQHNVNSKASPTKPKEKADEPHVVAPNGTSKEQKQPKEKDKAKAKAKADEPHVLAPKGASKEQKQPKEKDKAKAKADESHANAHKVKEPKKKPDGKTDEQPTHKVSSKPHKEPAKNCEDKAQKAPAKDLKKKESFMRLSREEMKEIFREHDVDCDGFLDYGELTMAFHFLDPILPCYKARDGIAYADANKDGLISEDELDKLMDYAEKLYGDDLVY